MWVMSETSHDHGHIWICETKPTLENNRPAYNSYNTQAVGLRQQKKVVNEFLVA